jgi:hypothetical protein
MSESYADGAYVSLLQSTKLAHTHVIDLAEQITMRPREQGGEAASAARSRADT